MKLMIRSYLVYGRIFFAKKERRNSGVPKIFMRVLPRGRPTNLRFLHHRKGPSVQKAPAEA